MVAFRLLFRTLCRFIENDGMARAGYIAFASLLAFFPFMIFIGALAGFVGDPEGVDTLMAFAIRFLPREVADTLEPLMGELLAQRRGGMLTIGVVGTLWAASAGVEAFRYALDRAWGATTGRSLWRRRLQGIALVLLAVMAFLVILLGAVIGPVLWELGLPVLDDAPGWEWLWDGARYVLAGLVLFAVTTVLYRWLPDWRPAWRDILPGALLASMGWLVLAGMFSVFLDQVDNFTVTYGSLGGILVTLLFLLFSAADFILGAEFNAALRDRREGA